MTYDRLENSAGLAGLGPRFARAFAWLRSHDLASLEPGRHDIEGDDIYVLIQHRPLKEPEAAAWESHRRYADIQLVLEGRERLGYALLHGSEAGDYDAEKDFCVLADLAGQQVDLDPGEFAVFLPHDAHRPLMAPDGVSPGTMVRKAVVKVRVAD
jgi:YhcH/YjgK/YiaL family protein